MVIKLQVEVTIDSLITLFSSVLLANKEIGT